MAKASQVQAQIQRQLDRIENKLDALLEANGLGVKAVQTQEPIKPTKTYVKPAVVAPETKTIPAEEQTFLKSGTKRKPKGEA